jgi:glycosyltransferase involved in cell wall biosynthesis
MNESTCIIIGAARNIAAFLPQTLQQINKIIPMWKEAAVVIAENGSTDATKQILADYKTASTRHRTDILTLDATANPIAARTVRLAHVRTKLLEHVHTHFPSFDYILMVDLDGVLDGFRIQTLETAFKPTHPPWDALFANTKTTYYDIWALRSKALGITFDCWDLIYHMRAQMGADLATAKAIAVKKYQTKIKPSTPLIPVESAFGGLGLYRLSKTIGCAYNGMTTFCSCKTHIHVPAGFACRSDTCEHVSFHKDMIEKNGAKLYIIPSIQVNSQEEHL